MTVPYVVGVDGARGGWLAIQLNMSGELTGVVAPEFARLLDLFGDASVIAVDIPIGVPNAATYPRTADLRAQTMIGRRRSTVFRVPPQEALAAASFAEANEISRRHGLPGVSQQSWALAPKIREVESHREDPRIREVHPEVSFAAMAGHSLAHSKKSWNGFMERLELLRTESLEPSKIKGNLGRAAVDDVLDALAAAWSARRIVDGVACSLPPGSPVGSPAIWY